MKRQKQESGIWPFRSVPIFQGKERNWRRWQKRKSPTNEGERAACFPLVPWEAMVKYKHKTYLFPWVSVRHNFTNAVSLQNVTQHDEVMLRRKTWLKLFFMSLSYATVSICCSSHGNMFLRSPRVTTWRNRLTDCPSCHFWTHHCFRAVFLGCSQSMTSTVWVLLHTFSAKHSMLGSFCLA